MFKWFWTIFSLGVPDIYSHREDSRINYMLAHHTVVQHKLNEHCEVMRTSQNYFVSVFISPLVS